jgi:hypothetical protein
VIIDVNVVEYHSLISSYEIGLSRDTHTVKTLRKKYAPRWFLKGKPSKWRADLAANGGFQQYVDKYAEVVALGPWDDVVEFFRRAPSNVSTLPPGPLSYPASYPLLNTAAMAAATEALAGWFCQSKYGWDAITRPPRLTPDLIFRDRTTKRWALVEVKSSGSRTDPQRKIKTEIVKVLKLLAATKALRPSQYLVGLVFVQVIGPSTADLTCLILEET